MDVATQGFPDRSAAMQALLDERMAERHKLLGTLQSDVSVAKALLRGQRLTPREASQLREIIDAGEGK